MVKSLLIPALLLAVWAAPAAGAERVELENGLTVLLDRRTTAPVVDVGIFIRAGRVHEPDRLAGMSHFLEHMMYRSTARRSTGDAEREVWRVGGRSRAFTHEDYTEYGVLLPSSELDLALDILSDSVLGAKLVPAEVEEERRVVLDEIRRRVANPQTWSFETVQGLSFLPHPYGARIAGSVRTVSRVTREDLLAHYRARYRPENTVLVVVGDFDRNAALAKVRKAFGGWERAERPAPPPPAPGAAIGQYQEVVARREGATPTVLASLALPGYLHPDYLPARFLRPILSGWLIQRIVADERAALTADIYLSPMQDRNVLTIRLPLRRPEDAGKARDALLGLFEQLRSPNYVFSSIDSVAENFQSRLALLEEDFDGLSQIIGRAALYGYYAADGRPEHLAAEDRYERIGSLDVKRVATRYLRPENVRVLFLLPPGAEAPAQPTAKLTTEGSSRFTEAPEPRRIPYETEDAAKAATGRPPSYSDARRTELSSGVRLLHLERSGVPVVAGAIVFPAGSKYDPRGKEGLAAFTMRALWSETKDAEGLRWRLFAMGYSTNFDVGPDTARVTFTVPRAHLSEALSVIYQMLTRPSFSEDAMAEARGNLLRSVAGTREEVARFGRSVFRKALLGGNRYSHVAHGTRESVERITKEDVLAFHERHLNPGRAVLALVGDLSPRMARNLAEQAISMDPGPLTPLGTAPPMAWPAPPKTERRNHPSGRTYVLLGGRAPALTARYSAEASLLRLVLGWQVFVEFTDVRSTAYRAGSFYDAFSRAGTFGLFVETSPKHAAETTEALRKFIETAVNDGIPEKLLADSRGAWLGGDAVNRMRSVNVAFRLAYRELEGLGYDSHEAMVERVRKLTAEELKAACAKLFPKAACSAVLVNGKDGPAAPDPDSRDR